MMRQFKKPSSFQAELFETHDITWSMLSEEQRRQAVELLSKLFLEALRVEQTHLTQKVAQETTSE